MDHEDTTVAFSRPHPLVPSLLKSLRESYERTPVARPHTPGAYEIKNQAWVTRTPQLHFPDPTPSSDRPPRDVIQWERSHRFQDIRSQGKRKDVTPPTRPIAHPLLGVSISFMAPL
ncbi:hypothetical protein K443DRAFT_676766 [Laccaria amethystina LaAM-08-1]|uniref:Uncharacterized protein n=1 Tax=Laccaria amethystina LaAM-08-1 TaxID=1095629 RepID=A0A0C9WVF7_9AGAR|nr:hypothetical protein K443DRAFT_676766 [Laccaria amethystina LaAM-08-1]